MTGIDEVAASAAIARCWNIEWRDDPAHLESTVALMREYLRRSAIVAEAVGETANWPWYDAAVRLTLPGVDKRYLPAYVFLDRAPDYRGPGADLLEDKIIALNGHLNSAPGTRGWYGKKVCWWYIRWASIKNHPALVPLQLPDLYEPLIVLYERGGWFSREHAYIELGETMIGASFRNALQAKPLSILDTAVLDALDRSWKKPARKQEGGLRGLERAL